MMWTGTVRKVRGPHTRPDVLGFYTLLTYRSGPPLTTEVVGARRLSRIKRATRKGRNPRLRLVKAYLLLPGQIEADCQILAAS